MKINRPRFYRQIRGPLFPGGLSLAQVEGHEAILDAWQADHADDDDRWLAYILATAYHESAHTLQPARETLADSDAEAARRLEAAWRAGKLTWVKTPYWNRDADGRYWFGRGLVQLTFEANYRKLGAAIGVDLAADPDLALTMDIAVKILLRGMIDGAFAGPKLADFFHGATEDWTHARRIVNGLERANDIAGYGRAYHAALRCAV